MEENKPVEHVVECLESNGGKFRILATLIDRCKESITPENRGSVIRTHKLHISGKCISVRTQQEENRENLDYQLVIKMKRTLKVMKMG